MTGSDQGACHHALVLLLRDDKPTGDPTKLASASLGVEVRPAGTPGGGGARGKLRIKLSKNRGRLTVDFGDQGQGTFKITANWCDLVRIGAIGQTGGDRKRTGHLGVQ